jgi:hypothetical protein
MKYLVLALLLTVVQATPPVTRKTTRATGDKTGPAIKQNTGNNKAVAEEPATAVKKVQTAENQAASDDQDEQNTEKKIEITRSLVISPYGFSIVS